MGNGRLNGQPYKRLEVCTAFYLYTFPSLLLALLRKDPPYVKTPQVVKFWEQKRAASWPPLLLLCFAKFASQRSFITDPFASQSLLRKESFITDRSDQQIQLRW